MNQPAAFDDLAQRLDPAAVLAVTEFDGERSGCLVGFHSQCSINPLRYCVWLSRENHTYRVTRLARRLSIVVLSPEDRRLAELFGGETGDDLDKWTLMEREGLRLPEAMLEGNITEIFDVAEFDHVAFIVRPDAAESEEQDAAALRVSDLAGLTAGHEVN